MFITALTKTRLLCCSQGGVVNDGSELIGPAEAYPDSLANTFSEGGAEGKRLCFSCVSKVSAAEDVRHSHITL